MWGTEEEKQQFGKIWPLSYGDEATRDYKLAAKRLLALTEQGYAPAQFALAMAYFDGKGVRRNYAECFRYCLTAAEADYPEAANMIGSFYAGATPNYKVCPQDSKIAVRWFLRAAELGNAGAQFNLATCYKTGNGVEQDYIEAYIWASLAVHCSPIRIRPAEVFRDQSAAELNPEQISAANARISKLSSELPLLWSSHMVYWKSLSENKP